MFDSDPGHNFDDGDEELSLVPRLSMNLNELDQGEDEQDTCLPVPRYLLPLDNRNDMDYMYTTIELGRRAVTERPY